MTVWLESLPPLASPRPCSNNERQGLDAAGSCPNVSCSLSIVVAVMHRPGVSDQLCLGASHGCWLDCCVASCALWRRCWAAKLAAQRSRNGASPSSVARPGGLSGERGEARRGEASERASAALRCGWKALRCDVVLRCAGAGHRHATALACEARLAKFREDGGAAGATMTQAPQRRELRFYPGADDKAQLAVCKAFCRTAFS
eukprot:6203873-Pleurochrysis_carterae.AAC.10